MFFFVSLFSFSVWVWALFAWRNFFWCFMGKMGKAWMAAGLRPHYYYITSTGWDRTDAS
jgi:hypothetical protein